MPSEGATPLCPALFADPHRAAAYQVSSYGENPPKGRSVPGGSPSVRFPGFHPSGLLKGASHPPASDAGQLASGILAAFTVDEDALTIPLARLAGMRSAAAVARVDAPRMPVIGILTALPEEFTAMVSLIDGVEERMVAGDPAEYVCGTIPSAQHGRPHPVVLTLLTETGNNWAATAVTNMLRSFESIDQVLMVGIAAGVPAPCEPHRHVRLGDVVVATWGIVDYDHVVDWPGGVSLRQGFPQPSALLAQRVKRLAAAELQARRPWEDELAVLLERLPSFVRPAPASDRLYLDDQPVRHPDPAASGHRPGVPKVHQGRIGSANRSLRNAARRDALAREYDLRAIEMEGSGIGSSAFASGRDWLVIRGISDYGDHRMGTLWRPYASAVAAAYTRALLRRCPPITPHGGRVGG
jgi:nucleoside phosphorylase